MYIEIQLTSTEWRSSMDITQKRHLLLYLKTLGDENRLTMVGMMGDQERTVSEMAEMLGLTDPTVSHHISKLHNAGLLRLRMAGNQRFYRLNKAGVEKFKALVTVIDTPLTETEDAKSDNAWIKTLDWSEEDKKVLVAYTFNGRLTDFPSKDKK